MKHAASIALAALVATLTGCHPAVKKDEHAGHVAPLAVDPHAAHAQPSTTPSGYAPVMLDPARIDGMQLSTAVVEEKDFVRKVRTVGIVAVDETRTAHVHAKVRGFIEGIYVNYIGKHVRAGEALCAIYSQEVFAAEIEFLAILDRAATPLPVGSEFADGERRAQQQLINAARRRLSLWDVPKSEIARLESTREARRTFALASPRAGVVVAKQALDGVWVDPSLELYTITDLSRVWVLVDVYEGDVPYVKAGDHAQLRVEGHPDSIDAAVAFLPPTIDESTRTLKVRFELANPGGHLRPGAFVNATMDLPLGKGLAVPENAVIRTGTRAIVFVVHGNHIEPREITLGPLVDDAYRVEGGVTAGDLVAVGAQFLLDSESRLRATSGVGGGHAH